MKFNSKAGQELRTWILFFSGIGLAAFLAIQGSPLSPWWTLVIGAFTCTAVIVSAVQAIAGGMSDAARKAIEEAKRAAGQDPGNGLGGGSQEPPSSTLSFVVGPRCLGPLLRLRRSNTVPI